MGIDIHKFVKPGKDIVIDLEDGVEYLVDDNAVVAIERGDQIIELIGLYGGKHYALDIKDILVSLQKKGVIDYLDKRE